MFFKKFKKNLFHFGKILGIDPQRCYSNYSEMADKENKLKNKIDVVAIMTPPGSHQKIAEKFIDKNIHIISDKPFAANLKQQEVFIKKLKVTTKSNMSNHNYSAYPMVREAKILVGKGKIGKIEYVNF